LVFLLIASVVVISGAVAVVADAAGIEPKSLYCCNENDLHVFGHWCRIFKEYGFENERK